ncbi:MAG TPA: carboxypeptidase regulatory-like domain-containing protein, partial [Gemmatimonadaceae bacterium]|nr:carboxypeptidase regulatory-like domain-containing protein [Gemmatimonadaceae bacterium]
MLARFVASVALFALSSPAAAQILVTGHVRTADGAPLEGARVSVLGKSGGATTDARGAYRFVVRKTGTRTTDSVSVRAARIGFIAREQRVRPSGDTVRVDFTLAPAAVELEAVAVDAPPREMRVLADRAYSPTAKLSAGAAGYAKSSRGGARGGHPGAIADAGVLTAAVWDDLAHWAEFQKYLGRANSAKENPWQLDPSHAKRPSPVARGSARAALDLGFLVDATGSMGDEMTFLQTELRDIVTRVRAAEPELDIRVSIVFYRDRGDEFVTKTLPFTRDVDSAVAFMGATMANGGGDYPEDMNAGLAEVMRQQWSHDVAPRMLFVVGDAPPQRYEDERYTFREAISEASEDRIAIYPVAASGIDKPTEFLFRSMAAMTGGKYIFLTDDS